MSLDNTTTIEVIKTIFGTVICGELIYGIVNNENMTLKMENYRLRNELYQAIRKIELYTDETNDGEHVEEKKNCKDTINI